MALLDDFSVHDNLARLWPQTEWLKSAIRLAVLSKGEGEGTVSALYQMRLMPLIVFSPYRRGFVA